MRTSISLVLVWLAAACGGHDRQNPSGSGTAPGERRQPAAGSAADPTGGRATGAARAGGAAPGEAPDREPSCEQRAADLDARVHAIAERHRACRYDVECVEGGVASECYSPCGEPIHPRGVSELVALSNELDESGCGAWREAGCSPLLTQCQRWLASCREGRCVAGGNPANDDVPAPTPASNAPELDAPPPRPPTAAAQEKARRLFEAIVHDDPSRASDFFLPREAFLRVKAIADPGGYWDRLYARYRQDIGDLHENTADLDRARFERLEIVRRGGWVGVRDEGNAVPYWASRHSWLHYTVDEEPRKLEVRVLITWDDEWWITHLNEFH